MGCSQCIGLETSADGSAAAQWTWDWLDFIGGVKAYPEIIFGQKPGTQSTTPELPRPVNQISSLVMRYDITSTSSGTANLAFDIWLTNTLAAAATDTKISTSSPGAASVSGVGFCSTT